MAERQIAKRALAVEVLIDRERFARQSQIGAGGAFAEDRRARVVRCRRDNRHADPPRGVPRLHRSLEPVDQMAMLAQHRAHVGTRKAEGLHRGLRPDRCAPDRTSKRRDVAHKGAAAERAQHASAGSAPDDLDLAAPDQVGVVAPFALAQKLVACVEPNWLEPGRELVDRARRQVGERARALQEVRALAHAGEGIEGRREGC